MSETGEVVVFQSADPTELGMAKSVLEGAGVRCRLEGGSNSAFLTVYVGAGAPGVQSLVVPAELEDEAVKAIEAAFLDEGGEETTTEQD